jgi:hypothetical protein
MKLVAIGDIRDSEHFESAPKLMRTSRFGILCEWNSDIPEWGISTFHIFMSNMTLCLYTQNVWDVLVLIEMHGRDAPHTDLAEYPANPKAGYPGGAGTPGFKLRI